MATEAQLAALERGRQKRMAQYAERRARGEVTTAQEADSRRKRRLKAEKEGKPFEPPPASADHAPKPSPSGRNVGGRPAGYSPKSTELTRIRTGLVMMFTAAGMGMSMLDAYDGQVVATNAERLADVWTEVAETNAKVRKVLATMLEGSAIGQALMTTSIVFVPIAVHHGMAGESLLQMAETMGVNVPDDRASTPAPPPRPAPVARPVSVPNVDTAPGAGRAPDSANGRQPEPENIPEQSFEDVTLPGYSGPPDRAA